MLVKAHASVFKKMVTNGETSFVLILATALSEDHFEGELFE